MKKGNLLIVDDEPILVKYLKTNLEPFADTVYTASDGVEALGYLESETIHCVICDINMPRMNGIEVIRRIREVRNQVPFIFFTGHGNHDLMLEVAKYGAYDFFDKPNFEGLEDVIMKGLRDGFHRNEESAADDSFLNDYQKILNSLREE